MIGRATRIGGGVLLVAVIAGLMPCAAGGDRLARTKRFVFHANPWINLHHFLYHTAEHDDADLDGLSATERTRLAAAVEHYREQVIDADLLFDEDLFRLKRWLVEQDPAGPLPESETLPEVVGWLERVRPIYDEHFWPRHLARNTAVVAEHVDAIRRYEQPAARRLTSLAQADWPNGRIRVDVSYRANWAGAYTTVQPETHVVIATAGDWPPGDWIELVFHESSHALIGGRRGAVADAIGRAEEALDAYAPRQLWHAMLFYFTGRTLEDLIEADTGEPYELIMVREKIFDAYQPDLGIVLEPYLRGEIDLDAAVRDLIESINALLERRKAQGE